jgi:hypothetical protein
LLIQRFGFSIQIEIQREEDKVLPVDNLGRYQKQIERHLNASVASSKLSVLLTLTHWVTVFQYKENQLLCWDSVEGVITL